MAILVRGAVAAVLDLLPSDLQWQVKRMAASGHVSLVCSSCRRRLFPPVDDCPFCG